MDFNQTKANQSDPRHLGLSNLPHRNRVFELAELSVVKFIIVVKLIKFHLLSICKLKFSEFSPDRKKRMLFRTIVYFISKSLTVMFYRMSSVEFSIKLIYTLYIVNDLNGVVLLQCKHH